MGLEPMLSALQAEPSDLCTMPTYVGWTAQLWPDKLKSSQSQISFIAWKIRKIGEASADTAATETCYMKGIIIWKKKRLK